MKSRIATLLIVSLVLLSMTLGLGYAQGPRSQGTIGTAFGYQGRLNAGGSPAEGLYDFEFRLYDAATDGTQVVGTVTTDDVAVSRGLFTVDLDFGPNVFTGQERWLEIAVKGPGDAAFTTLSPRQALMPTPYALYAAGGPFWSLGGNAGTDPTANFVGTTDPVSLTLAVSGTAALRLELTDGTPNVVGGHPENSAVGEGATVGGGGVAFRREFDGRTVWWYEPNTASSFGAVGGGLTNKASGYAATVGGGEGNIASGPHSTIGGGGGTPNDWFGAFPMYGGGWGNTASGAGATIAGGIGNEATGSYATVGGGVFNKAWAAHATIGGGGEPTTLCPPLPPGEITPCWGNLVVAEYGTIAGGGHNVVGDFYGDKDAANATIGGGWGNTASDEAATVAGGDSNTASGAFAAVGGGGFNTASGTAATVPGGESNAAEGDYSFAAGRNAKALHEGAFVWADSHPSVGGFASDGPDTFSVRASGGVVFTSTIGSMLRMESVGQSAGKEYSANIVGGYSANEANGIGITISGGGGRNHLSGEGLATAYPNRAIGNFSTVGGGQGNEATGSTDHELTVAATVSGGFLNKATHSYATVGGGTGNLASDLASTVAGGDQNSANGLASTVGGGFLNIVGGTPGTFIGWYATIGGGAGNKASADYATISGGGSYDANLGNRVTDEYGTVGGGLNNQAGDAAGATDDRSYATVGGGKGNTASGEKSTVAGGENNRAMNSGAAVGGGINNTANGWGAVVAGGNTNNATTHYATVGGGSTNTASGQFATIPGGYQNAAAGMYSFAAGRKAVANSQGCFIWGDSNDAQITCTVPNRWMARATGGIMFYSNAALTTGVYVAAGGSSWNVISDRATKENFVPIDGQEIAAKVAAMPIQEYNLKTQDASIRHVGPVAQDFHAAFGYGESNTAINLEDADGIALAAIQGLYQMVQEQKDEISALQKQNADLETRLSALESAAGIAPRQAALPKSLLPGTVLLIACVGLVWRTRRGGVR